MQDENKKSTEKNQAKISQNQNRNLQIKEKIKELDEIIRQKE